MFNALCKTVPEENMIEVPTDVVNSADNVIITFYNDSALFQLAEPINTTNFTYFPDTAVLGFAVGNDENYDNLNSTVRINLQGISARSNKVW